MVAIYWISGFTRATFRGFGILFVALFFTLQSFGQEIKVTARVDSNNILVGDWLKLHLEARHAENVAVIFPAIADSLEGFEIVKRESPVLQKSNQQVLESATFVLTAFDTGTYVIPPLAFQYTLPGDDAQQIAETSPIAVFVHSVGVDTSKDIKDVKPPLSLPISFAEMLPYILGTIGAGLAAWLVYYIMKKRKRGETLLPQAPPRPAHEVALDALRALEAEKLWQRGVFKEYHSRLTDIVRIYIEHRYNVKAMEMITDEILSSPVIKALDAPVRDHLQEMLVLADLVKFAKFQPNSQEHERSLQSAFSFVEKTWRTSPEPARQEIAQEVSS